jgi:hypothetical protein
VGTIVGEVLGISEGAMVGAYVITQLGKTRKL